MEAQQVVEKILTDAETEAEKIKKQAEERQTAEQVRLDEQLAEYKKQTELLARKAAEDEKMHLLAAARMSIAAEYLAEKRKIIDEVFQKARQRLLNLSDEKYKQLMTKLLTKTIETGDEQLIVDKNEKRIDREFIKQFNSKLGTDRRGSLKLSDEKQDIQAGFILKRKKIKTNVSLDVILTQARKELEIELAKELFA